MFKQLVNEATLTVRLSAAGPLLIRSGEANSLDPALPDMRFVRATRGGEETVYLPGSSLKGVFRSRYEQLGKLLGHTPCELFDRFNSCSSKLRKQHMREPKKDGAVRYNESCVACRLFGNLELGSRARFTDAYPAKDMPKPQMGMRNGVGIDRKTGAYAVGALYDFEVVESGAFEFEIHMNNFARYQLALLLSVLDDINSGFVTFGMGTSRGNGQMKVDRYDLRYCYFGDSITQLRGYKGNDLGGAITCQQNLFAQECCLAGAEEIRRALGITGTEALRAAAKIEDWGHVL